MTECGILLGIRLNRCSRPVRPIELSASQPTVLLRHPPPPLLSRFLQTSRTCLKYRLVTREQCDRLLGRRLDKPWRPVRSTRRSAFGNARTTTGNALPHSKATRLRLSESLSTQKELCWQPVDATRVSGSGKVTFQLLVARILVT